jgi:hypothetical protein
MLMTVGAANPVNIVGAFPVGESRIHLLDIDAAMRHLGMAGFAGRCCVLVVTDVAGNAADAFVDAHRRAVVAGSNLRAPVICSGDGGSIRLARRVALIAESLALVGTDFYRARTI